MRNSVESLLTVNTVSSQSEYIFEIKKDKNEAGTYPYFRLETDYRNYFFADLRGDRYEIENLRNIF